MEPSAPYTAGPKAEEEEETHMRRKLIATALVAMFAATASAGATLTIETTSKEMPKPMYPGMPAPAGEAKEVKMTSVVKAEGDKLAMTTPSAEDPTGKTSSTAFNGKEMGVLDHEKKTFQLMTEEKMKEMLKRMEAMRNRMGGGMGGVGSGVPGGAGGAGGDIDASIARLKQSLASLPAGTPDSVRKMLEDPIKNLEKMKQPKAADGKPPHDTYTNEGGATFEGKTYTKWSVKDPSGVLKRHVYTLPASGATAEARESYMAFAKYMQKIMDLMPKNIPGQTRRFGFADEMEHIKGFPWVTVTYDEGKITETTRVKSAEEATHGDAVFVTRPDGYTESDPMKEMGGPGPGGGRGGRGR